MQIGTLIQVGNVWRVIDLPQPLAAEAQLTANGLFFQPPTRADTNGIRCSPANRCRSCLKELERLDALAAKAASREEQAKIDAERAGVMVEVANQAAKPGTGPVAAATGGHDQRGSPSRKRSRRSQTAGNALRETRPQPGRQGSCPVFQVPSTSVRKYWSGNPGGRNNFARFKASG